MILPKTLPTHPFWNFSVKIYKCPLVADHLIALQNERGLNVNMLLFCLWYGLTDQGRVTKPELMKIISGIQHWHERIVVPLRRMRQKLKAIPGIWMEIRTDILKHELFAEQIEQLIMANLNSFKAHSIRNSVQKIIDVCKNIALYCRLIQISLDHEDCKRVRDILATIFSKIDQEDILRYCMEHLIEKELQSLKIRAQYPLDL